MMSNNMRLDGGSDDVFALKENGQLATPALTPITEHVPHHPQRFPDYYGGDEQQEEIAKRDIIEDGSTQTTQPNGTISRRSRQNSSASHRASKLSPSELQDFVHAPDNLPVRLLPDEDDVDVFSGTKCRPSNQLPAESTNGLVLGADDRTESSSSHVGSQFKQNLPELVNGEAVSTARPSKASRSASTPLIHRKQSSSKTVKVRPQLTTAIPDDAAPSLPNGYGKPSPGLEPLPSPMPSLPPIPPLSLPTYLQLELSSDRPSALYIHRSASLDAPYESSSVKFERLLNFLYLPPNLEKVLWFGTVACLDSWLYTFTILPLRFFKAISIFLQWFIQNVSKEIHDLAAFVYSGTGRVWSRRRRKTTNPSERIQVPEPDAARKSSISDFSDDAKARSNAQTAHRSSHQKRRSATNFRHRRTKSTPSALLPNHKADILQGLLIIISCTLLTSFDASRMYHSIRGQAAIKLYVIYNVLEVFDRLFSALGQDVLECLFSKETLERDEHGRSKILRPMWMFLLALVYNVVHTTALFYQVVTLNVAVNSYNNALLTLLMSNQFVEIKGTVFKKFEKENLFQMTCADIVERFQLWLLLLIIALRNIVEVGGLSISLSSGFGESSSQTEPFGPNGTTIPLTSGFVIPKAFTLFPKWTGEVLGPFLIVLGSEALVDWCKHAYINKFNNVKPNIYGRFLDVLAKDYYTHAFSDQNLTRRLGLPVIPLSCLVIRACMQTYHMFLATHMPMPIASSVTGISVESAADATSPSTTAALQHIDEVFRRALGRSSFGAGGEPGSAFSWWSIDDVIAFATMCFFFLALWLVLLAFKLILGMALLSFARKRYKGMKEREQQVVHTEGKRVGRLATVEVGEDRRRWIYADDVDGLKDLREKEDGRKKRNEMNLDSVQRYSMAAKRIW